MNRIKGSPYAGVVGMKGQASASDAAVRGFQYPGKAKREGPKFENEFRLQRNEEARLIMVTDIVWFAGHMMPTRYQDRWGKADYTLQRCSRVTEMEPTEEGFNMVAGEGSRRCVYCEHEVFGNEPKGYGVIVAYTDNTYTKKNGDKIGPRLVFLVLSDRDDAIMKTLATDFTRYGYKRTSTHFPHGTMIGSRYTISRGSGQQSRSIGERLEIDRDENDRPVMIDPLVFLKKIRGQVKSGKLNNLQIDEAFPVATPEEQKLLIANAVTLNERYKFVKTLDLGVSSAAIDDDDDDDDIDMFGGSSLSGLRDTIAKQRNDSDDDSDDDDGDLEAEEDEEEEAEDDLFEDTSEEDEEDDETDEIDDDPETEESDEEEESEEDEEDSTDEEDGGEEEDTEDDDESGSEEEVTEDDAEDVAPLKNDNEDAFDEVDYVEANPPAKKKKSGAKATSKKKTSKKKKKTSTK